MQKLLAPSLAPSVRTRLAPSVGTRLAPSVRTLRSPAVLLATLVLASGCRSSFDLSGHQAPLLNGRELITQDGEPEAVPAEWSAEVELVEDRDYRLMVPDDDDRKRIFALRVRDEHIELAEADGFEPLDDLDIESPDAPERVGEWLVLRDGKRRILVPVEDVRRVHVQEDLPASSWAPFVVLGALAGAVLIGVAVHEVSSFEIN
jgi:hypothetical protein